MIRPLPTKEHVHARLVAELEASRSTGRRATITNVERDLGVSHATFYRNHPDLIDWFKAQLAADRDTAPPPTSTARRDEALTRLRRENSDLRKQVRIYAEMIRQLSLDKAALEDQLQRDSGVTRLADFRRE